MLWWTIGSCRADGQRRRRWTCSYYSWIFSHFLLVFIFIRLFFPFSFLHGLLPLEFVESTSRSTERRSLYAVQVALTAGWRCVAAFPAVSRRHSAVLWEALEVERCLRLPIPVGFLVVEQSTTNLVALRFSFPTLSATRLANNRQVFSLSKIKQQQIKNRTISSTDRKKNCVWLSSIQVALLVVHLRLWD